MNYLNFSLICDICDNEIKGHGNNAEPFKKGRCCDTCNNDFVIPERLKLTWIKPEKPDTIVKSIVSKFQQRSDVGIKKYNTTLDREDLSTEDWAIHLQEELMDATLYIEKLLTLIRKHGKI
jgi:hypothetical protein